MPPKKSKTSKKPKANIPPAPPLVAIGRIVHYRLPEKPEEIRPAMIVKTWGSETCVQLAVFLDKANDTNCNDFASSAQREDQVAVGNPGSWFWPPRT